MPDQTDPPTQHPPAAEPSGGQTAVAEAPPAARQSPPKLDHLPPYRVLLHNDDHNAFEFVVATVMELVSYPIPRAVEITTEAHRTGVALVIVCHLERAELIREQFQSKGLTSSIEKPE